VPEGLICSFPTRFNGTNVEIVQGVELDEFSRQKVDASGG
jgi:malate dehydrogenase